MTSREKLIRLSWIYQVLDLINIDRVDFELRLGKKGTEIFIDELLDELYELLHS